MQGFNMGRYRPPDTLDTSLSSDSLAKRRKTHVAAPTIRFEMPFAIWCSSCPHSTSLIGQGVRFNAFKTKVGNYFSTPIWQFRMKHTACGGWIEIRTDPRSSEYVVSEGARKRQIGDDAVVAERTGGVILGQTPDQAKRSDAFAALEGKQAERQRVHSEAKQIEQLKSLRERDWRDTDSANSRLRASFRSGRKERDLDAEVTDRIKETMGFDFDLVAASDEDAHRARLVDFGAIAEGNANAQRMFATSMSTENPSKLGHVLENTRAVQDPFLGASSRRISSAKIQGVRRETRSNANNFRNSRETFQSKNAPTQREQQQLEEKIDRPHSLALVDYDSDDT